MVEMLEGYPSSDAVSLPLQRREKILFLLSENEYKQPIADWDKYMFEATKLGENYYYSVIKQKISSSIDWDKVVF